MKLSKQEKTYAQIAGVGVAILIIGYYMCWWGGPHALINAQWCPASCWLTNDSGGGGGGGSGGGSGIVCPPIDAKLRQSDAAVMNQWAAAAVVGGTWFESSTLIASQRALPDIDCHGILQMPAALKLIYDANLFGAKYHCQPDWTGIWCPGDGPLPYPPQTTCGWNYNSGQTEASCGGPCPASQECEAMGDVCTCVDSGPDALPCSGYASIDEHGLLTCADNGVCPPGLYCTVMDAPLNGNAYCACGMPN